MTGFLRGSATAMITPFNENGVDLAAHLQENGYWEADYHG